MPKNLIKFNIYLVLLFLLGILFITFFSQRSLEKEIGTPASISDRQPQQMSDLLEANNTPLPKIETQSKSILKSEINIVHASKVLPKVGLDSVRTDLETEGQGPFAPSEALKVQESFKVDPPMRLIGQDWKNGRKTSNFTMPVSEGRDLEIQVERFESTGEDGGEFTGTVVGAPGSTVNLSYRGSAEAGRIDIPSEGRSYQILPAQDGAIIVQDRNPSLEPQAGALFPPEGIELPPVPNFIPPPPPSGIFEAIPPAEPLP